MSLALVAIASLMLTTTAMSVATMHEDAVQAGRAMREQGNAAGRALLAPCDTVVRRVATTRWPTVRLRVDEALSSAGMLHRRRVDVRWTASALATDAARDLHVSSAARCR